MVHHTPSPALQAMFEAAVSGTRTDEIEGVEVVVRPALTAAAADVLEADGYLLGAPDHARLGVVSRRAPEHPLADERLVPDAPARAAVRARGRLPGPGRGRPVTTVARRTNGTSGNEAN